MTKSPWWWGASQRLHAMFSGRLPFAILFACVLVVNWSAAIWVIRYTFHQRESEAVGMVNDEARYSAQKIGQKFHDADEILLGLRARHSGNDWQPELARQPKTDGSGGIALIAPDGRIVASTPHADTAGWPDLMARLATGSDVLAVGEPGPGQGGDSVFVPVARRVVSPDGVFGGILMDSLPVATLSRLSPAVAALGGCMTLATDDDVVLARTPELRGAAGVRMMQTAVESMARAGPAGLGRHVSQIDGTDRIFSYRQLRGIPVRVFVGISYDAAFAEWRTLRATVTAARLFATAVLLVIGYFWYSRRRRAKISGDALTAILASVDHGIRVESRDGRVIAANAAGAVLNMPATTGEQAGPDGRIVGIVRHDLEDGGRVFIGTDVTARHEAEARITFLTNHDRLTGLPNRWHATARIEALLAGKSEPPESESPGSEQPRLAALILFDLDGFQDINDTMGHEGGDTALLEVAGRLRDLVGDRDVVARLGGDEFLLFLNDPGDEPAIMALARQLPRALARPISVRGHQLRLGASLGIALYPRDGGDVATLFQHADIALSRAKMAGRGTAQRFDPAMLVSFEEHQMMESDLRRALDSDELELSLQPQFACDTLDVTGFEALARWRHPTRGLLSPAMFIPIAERCGLISALGLWAIERACVAAAGWKTRHRVAVNLSPLQLRDESIQDDIRGILRRTQFPAHLLELEVTESVLLDEDQRTLETLHKLRAMDIRVTLDDFGTGYSSLSYLRRFPFDKIKIDKSFVQGQSSDRGTRVILEAMIRMCTDLGLDVVAEGVETEVQLNEMRRLGCREIQGFLLGEPLLPRMVEQFLATHARRDIPDRIQNVSSPAF